MSGEQIFGFTTLAGCLYVTTKTVNYVTDGDVPHPDRARKLSTTTAGTGITTTVLSSYSATRQALHKSASAYIESLDDNQLATLCEKLDNVDEKTFESEKTLTKKL